MFIVDSHCHLDGLDYEKNHRDLDDVIAKAAARDVKFMLAIATTLPGFHTLKSLVGERKNIALSCGVHPLNQEEAYDVEEFRRLSADPQVVALGETGLDYHYQPETKDQQQRSFREHIRTGIALNKPIIVHTRDAREDTLAILREEQVERCGGVLHCFTEDQPTAAKLLDMGFYISFPASSHSAMPSSYVKLHAMCRWIGCWWKRIRLIWPRCLSVVKRISPLIRAMLPNIWLS